MNNTLIICILSSITLFLCTQHKDNKILGNWRSIKATDDNFYVETYFGENYFQSFNEFGGLMPSKEYFTEKNKIFLISIDGERSEFYATFQIDNDTLRISTAVDEIYLKKINQNEKTLQDYLNKIILRDEYWKAFISRKVNEWGN